MGGRALVLACALAAGLATPGHGAADASPSSPGFVSEVRLGLLEHDVVFPSARRPRFEPFTHVRERGANLTAELLFVSPSLLRNLLAPRPRVGLSVNTCGDTNHAYADLVWGHAFQAGPFAEGYLGGAVHDGALHEAGPHASALGSRLLFHLGLELGWRVGPLGLSLAWEHLSNGNLAHPNHGLDDVGFKVGWRFDAG